MAKPMKPRFRRGVSAPGLISLARRCFERMKDPITCPKASLADHLMAAMAMFWFKCPSMPRSDDHIRGRQGKQKLTHNLKALFGIRHVPCDTSMRERIDKVSPEALRPAFKAVFFRFQRGNGLKCLACIWGRYLVAINVTEYFKSDSISFAHCCWRNKRASGKQFYHQMLAACLVSPGNSATFPLMLPEMIRNSDGDKKNDCELNAFKRLTPALRREYRFPHQRIHADALDAGWPGSLARREQSVLDDEAARLQSGA